MSAYGIFLNEANETAWETVRKTWPERHLVLTDHMAFVAPEGITTTAQISEMVGLGGDANIMGLVLEVSAHHGFNRSELWEWLQNAKKYCGRNP